MELIAKAEAAAVAGFAAIGGSGLGGGFREKAFSDIHRFAKGEDA